MTEESGKYDVKKLRQETGSSGFNLLSLRMGLDRLQQQLIIRVIWVLIVSTHILWVCGLLTSIGLGAPFARADTVEDLQRTASITARLETTSELRTQTLLWCSAKDPIQRQAIEQMLDRLRDEYRRVTKGETPPEYRCGS